LLLRLFGPIEVQVGGTPLPRLRSRKGFWLLALLALRHGRNVERDWVGGTLWPESDDPQMLASLRKTLNDLRTALGSEAARLYSPTPRTLRLELAGAAVDVRSFDEAIARGDEASLVEAISLYRGVLLEGCVEEWILSEQRGSKRIWERWSGWRNWLWPEMRRRRPSDTCAWRCRWTRLEKAHNEG
jgi:DNA-binding SARP family transcriptional activator